MTVGPGVVPGTEMVPGVGAVPEAKEALRSGVVPGVGPVELSGSGFGVALADAPGAELEGGADGGWCVGVRRILAAMGTSSSSPS